MRLENVLALTHGKLVNEPFVSTFTNIIFDAKAVKRGDLFMAFDESTIEDAILNGAYGVVFCKPTQISDSEIAWIKVVNIEDALQRLLRFRLIDKEIVVYESDEIVLSLALQIITEQNFIVLHGNIKTIFKSLWDCEKGSIILFCPTLVNRDIFTTVNTLSTNAIEQVNIIEQTLFETSFIYDNIFYERQLISPFFMPYLEMLLHLYKSLKINYRIRKFTQIEHFEAVFTNKKFEIKEFGTSDKVLIFEKNSSLVEQEIQFLQREATWAKITYLIPSKCKDILLKLDNINNVYLYNNSSEIINILRLSDFHFALIMGVDKSILEQPLKNKTQMSLFDFE